MEEIIKKAIEGGWKNKEINGEKIHRIVIKDLYTPFSFFLKRKKRILWTKVITIKFYNSEVNLHLEKELLDYSFWKALAISCGWNEIENYCDSGCGCEYPNGSGAHEYECSWRIRRPDSLWYSSNFYEINLIHGGDKAVDYLKSLI